jgi:hypothetical protein
VILLGFADRFNRTGVKSFFAKISLLVGLGLLVDVRVPIFVVATKVSGRSVATHIAVDTLRVDKELAWRVVG